MPLALPSGVTVEEAGALLPALAGAIDGGALRVDATALAQFDTAALALLLEARRRAEAAGAAFEVHGAPPQLVELAKLYGVDGLLSLT